MPTAQHDRVKLFAQARVAGDYRWQFVDDTGAITASGQGELSAKVTIDVAGATKTAAEAVEKAGGKVNVIGSVPARRHKGGTNGRKVKAKD